MLLLKTKPTGDLRPLWYGRFRLDGKIRETPLCRWKGKPPASEKAYDEGDQAFEKSRTVAEKMLEEFIEGRRSEADKTAMVERIYRAKYEKRGPREKRRQTIGSAKIADLYQIWKDRPRNKRPSSGRDAVARNIFDRFADYMKRTAPRTTETGALRKEHIDGYLAEVEAEGVSARTWNGHLQMLRGAILRADPFAEINRHLKEKPAKPEATAHRTPFTADELERVFAAAAERDPLIHGLIVTAACTALRRGDVAKLRWSSVDLKAGYVTVKTSKTGEDVEIPIFPPLRTVLESIPRRGPFVFPEAEKIYRRAPDTLDRRLQQVLADAGFVRPPRSPKASEFEKADPEEITEAVEAAMNEADWTERRREKARAILQRHLAGEPGRQIAAGLAISPGAVSTYLHDLEALTGFAVVSEPAADEPDPSTLTVGEINPEAPRKRRPSLKGWHSFRTTWTTFALANNVPMDIVTRVTGHRTAEIVSKNYFRPGREQFRKALSENMPRALVGDGAGEAKPEPLPAWAVKKIKSAKSLKDLKAAILKGGVA